MNRQILPVILCVMAMVCNATTYYVSTSGSDENDGPSHAHRVQDAPYDPTPGAVRGQ